MQGIKLIYHKVKNLLRKAQILFLLADLYRFKKRRKTAKRFKIQSVFPIISDKIRATGFDRHYLYHTAWAARKVKEINPELHVDIASSLYFCSLVSAFVPVKFYDYRPPLLELSNLEVYYGNLLELPFKNQSVSSLSCMHTVEHVGLGRYGDPIDPDGDLKAVEELKRVLAPGGSLLFVVPIGGKAKIMFNAHRIYTYEMIVDYFKDLSLKEFSLIPEFAKDSVGIITNAAKEQRDKENYGCGCFWFIK